MSGYIGVNNVARKIKTMYVGVNGVARKVNKAYVGIVNKARLWFALNTKPSYYGSAGTISMAGVTNGASLNGNGYFVFSSTSSDFSNVIDKFNSNLTHTTFTMSVEYNFFMSSDKAICSIDGYYIMYGGGMYYDVWQEGMVGWNYIKWIDSSDTITQSYLSDLGGSGNRAASSSQKYMITHADNGSQLFIYNTSKTLESQLSIGAGAGYNSTASFNDVAVFAGGLYNSSSTILYNRVFMINNSGTRTNLSALSEEKYSSKAVPLKNYLLIAGGTTSNGTSKSSTVVEYFDKSFTKHIGTSLSVTPAAYERENISGGSINDNAIFCIGIINSSGYSTLREVCINMYDSSLTQSIEEYEFSTNKINIATADAGNYLLFAGGSYPNRGSSIYNNQIEAYY